MICLTVQGQPCSENPGKGGHNGGRNGGHKGGNKGGNNDGSTTHGHKSTSELF